MVVTCERIKYRQRHHTISHLLPFHRFHRDGDFFSLIWDDRFRLGSEYEPMDYTGPTPVKSILPVTVDQTKKVNFPQRLIGRLHLQLIYGIVFRRLHQK